jgi:hypothetical protein
MNQRIQELEDQCWEDIPVDIDYDYLSRVRRVFNRQKFAQLIVEDCRSVIDRVYHNTPLELCGPLLSVDQEIATHFLGVVSQDSTGQQN